MNGLSFAFTGEKNSVSHLHIAGATLVYARQPGSTRSAGVSAFLVETDRPGVSAGAFTDMGQGPIGRGTLHMDDVFVPAENLVGEEGRAFAMVMSHFDYSRAAIGLQCLGAARSSLTETYAYVRQRRFRDVFGYQIGDGTAQIQKQVIASRLIGPEARDR